MQADIYRIAKLLRRLFWRQNASAAKAKNATRRGRSTLGDDDSILQSPRLSAEHTPPISSRKSPTQRLPQLSHSAVLTQRTQDWFAAKDELRELPSHGLPDSSTDLMESLPLENINEHLESTVRRIRGPSWGEESRRPIDLENESDEYGEHGTLTTSMV